MTAKPITEEALAHVAEDGRPHFLREHLEEVARRARDHAIKYAPDAAFLAGLWHDLGKYSGDFQNMIRSENGFASHIEAEGLARDHSTAGAIHACTALTDGSEVPLAFTIAGHHAGLADAVDLKNRLAAKQGHYDAVIARAPPSDILSERRSVLPDWAAGASKTGLEFWIRMLFSALVDADFLDTEAFYSEDRASQREASKHTIEALQSLLANHMALFEAAAEPGAVNIARREIRSACERAGLDSPGLFTLSVPTGGGKTLAAMAFALRHAVEHGKRRVIVVIPFTSIIEQNAQIYKQIFGEDAVLEHHSALDPRRETPRNRIAVENWDAPIVVTTTVQFFESLFGNRTSACRKLHNLVDSVVVLDEAQSLPPKLLPPILDVMTELMNRYGVSFVVSTATQPAFNRSARLPQGLENAREICPPSMNLARRLERVRVVWPGSAEPTPYEVWAADAARAPAVLTIVHLRKDAHALCRLVDEQLGDESTVHLSALMTPAHRSVILRDVVARRKRGEAIRVVSTQLVEAGVDLDFPLVQRTFGGLDALAQAAGRCNREGRLVDDEGEPCQGELRVLVPPTRPPIGVPRLGADVAMSMWKERGDELDLFSPTVQDEYFRRLYSATSMKAGIELQGRRAEFAFKTFAQAFSLIENDWSSPVCVAHDEESQKRVSELRVAGPSRARLRALQRYMVNVPKSLAERWAKHGLTSLVHEIVAVIEGPMLAAYNGRFGLDLEKVGLVEPAELIG